MLKEDILQRFGADKPVLDRFGVKSIALFGSFARGEEREDSNLDIVVDEIQEAVE